MSTLILGSAESHETLEEFIEQLGDEEICIVGSDGRIRARVIPAHPPESSPSTDDSDCHSELLYQRFESGFLRDRDELKRRAMAPRSGVDTAELLKKLHSLPQPD